MYVIAAEALGFFIVNSGAVVDEALYHSNVCLHIHFRLANFVFCSTL
jgi:hypothetical protein